MAQLRITDDSDVERATIPISKHVIKREGFNVIPEAEVTVTRTDLNSVSGLTPGEDRAYIEEGGVDAFGGIVRSPDRQGAKSVIKVRGFEQYFARAPPVPTGQQKVNADDSTLITECINQTPELTAGTINTVEAGQTWVFGGISQWEKAKKVANAAGGELTVSPDRTVDYVNQIGSDKTATTLSPANQSFVEDTFVVSRDGVSGNTSHLLTTGVGQGTGQIEVAIVPADDTTTYPQYDRVATYTNPNWSDGDGSNWDTRGSKELKNEDAAEAWGKNVIAELQDIEVRVDTRVKGEAVNLGDRFHVKHPEEDVDENLRAVQVTELLAAAGGKRYEVVFSNYEVAHSEPTREDHLNAENYRAGAYEGDLVQLTQGPGRGPVNAGHDYVMNVYYPDDIVAEVNAQLLIKGLNYRAYSSGAAGGGDHTHSVPINITSASAAADSDNANPGSDILSSSTLGTNSQFTLPQVSGSGAIAYVYALVQNEPSGSTADLNVSIDNLSTGTTIEATSTAETFNPGDARLYQGIQTGTNLEGDTIEVSIEKDTAVSTEVLYSWGGMLLSDHAHLVDDTQTSDASGDHTHVPNPGIIDWDGSEQSPSHYPENVDVKVNGTSQGQSIGDGTGEFEQVVDLPDVLTQGWNEIRLTSDGLGHLDATFSADLFRQSL